MVVSERSQTNLFCYKWKKNSEGCTTKFSTKMQCIHEESFWPMPHLRGVRFQSKREYIWTKNCKWCCCKNPSFTHKYSAGIASNDALTFSFTTPPFKSPPSSLRIRLSLSHIVPQCWEQLRLRPKWLYTGTLRRFKICDIVLFPFSFINIFTSELMYMCVFFSCNINILALQTIHTGKHNKDRDSTCTSNKQDGTKARTNCVLDM